MNTRKFERRGLIITETLMVLLAVLWAVPIYYLIVTTLKSPAEATASPLALPSTINLQNYIDAWQKMEFPRAFANTLFITAMSVFLIVLFGSMAGYALARTSSKLGGRLFLFFLAGLVVPFQMNIVSLYKIVKALHLMNSPFAVILVDVAVNMPQAVFLFREFVHSTVPVELEEAAEIDGASKWTVFVKMVIPLSRSIMAVMVVYSMVAYWNDWFTAEDMAAYVPGFVQDGIIEGRQVVFPVSKSTQLIFLNGSQYARFAADTGAQLSTLATWDGFFEMAAAVFLRWLTEQQRNLEFAADTGYMPVSSAAFDAIADYPFEQQSYQRLYDVYNEMRLQNTPLSEPGIVGYHAKAKALYDSLHNTKKDTTRSLEIQYSVFQNDMERYFDQLAVMGVNLSEDMGALVNRQLASRKMTFEQLNDSPEVLNALEEEMIEPLCRSLRRTSCSGAFVLLDATVNTRMEGAEHSRAGLYVQKSGADTPTVPLLLYRGSADVVKTHSVMPHRKWRMEFQTDQFPDYDCWMTPSSTPLYQAYTLTERFSLPGTSEEVQLFLLPLRGRDGTMYGLCGFEISQSFFKQNFAQPTGFDHLICLLAPADSGLNASAALSSGTTGGYFHAPREMLVLRSMGSSLTQLIGSDSAYAGISELCRLSENQSYRLAVCIPMTDYRRLIFSGNLQMLLIGLFILFFVVFCCMYFHQHVLSPAFRQFEEDRRESRRRMDELQMERQQMQTELSRLADVCRNESVPDAFQTFLEGIPNLTKTERRIFDGYVAGLRSREIVEQLDIKDSTLRFHNKNIYEKLGVSSLKQLQQFAAILNSGGNSAPDSAPDESGPKKAR